MTAETPMPRTSHPLAEKRIAERIKIAISAMPTWAQGKVWTGEVIDLMVTMREASDKTFAASVYKDEVIKDLRHELERANAALNQEMFSVKEIAASAIIRLQNLGENTFQLDLVDSLRSDNAALAGQLATLRWIPVGEKLPTPLEDVMTWDDKGKCIRITWHDPDYDENKGWLCGSNYKAKITHWMPLPPQPIAARDGKGRDDC